MNSSMKLLKKIKLRQWLYPLVTVVFFLSVAAVFYKSLEFLLSSVNKAFASVDPRSVPTLTLDMADFEITARKLGIRGQEAITAPAPVPVVPSPAIPPASGAVAPTSTSTPLTSSTSTLLVVSIIDTRAPASPLTELKNNLVKAGFKVSTIVATGGPALPDTIVRIKDSKKAYQVSLRAIVEEKFHVGSIQTLGESSTVDATIFLGSATGKPL